jgi:hypothetical protein
MAKWRDVAMIVINYLWFKKKVNRWESAGL